MYEIFLKTLPFFALIGVGYISGVTRFFTEEATAYLTKFVFYFALSAMLFRFSSNLSLGDLFDWNFAFAYLLGSVIVYLLAGVVALYRRVSITEAASPTRNVVHVSWVAKAVAKIGARVETDPSISPANPGCTHVRMN